MHQRRFEGDPGPALPVWQPAGGYSAQESEFGADQNGVSMPQGIRQGCLSTGGHITVEDRVGLLRGWPFAWYYRGPVPHDRNRRALSAAGRNVFH